jgi:hypothetical protein
VDDQHHPPDTPPPVPPPGEPSGGSDERLPRDVDVTDDAPDGPPPPPFVRDRQRRRRRTLAILAALAVLAIPVGLAIASGLAERDQSPAGADDPAPPDGDGADDPRDDEAPDPEDGSRDPGDDGSAAPEPRLDPPDVAALSGLDAIYGQLLVDIDASERTMLDFQEGLADVLAAPGAADERLERASATAGASRAELLAVRERLTDGLDDAGADRVRELYVEHLDSWAEYLEAVEEDALVLAEDDTAYTVVINATADAFARALETELPDDIDREVERFAEGILDRGFRGFGQAEV